MNVQGTFRGAGVLAHSDGLSVRAYSHVDGLIMILEYASV
jgi:hypothetical protein